MGNKCVVADPRLCVSCKACMAACLGKHSVPTDTPAPRLKVTQLNKHMTAPIMCHQCDDPACVTVCPTGALFRDEENARIGMDPLLCFGCRSCVNACPYGAIDVTLHRNYRNFGGLVLQGTPHAVMIKCDRCADRPGGPVCVETCPHHALKVVERSKENQAFAIG